MLYIPLSLSLTRMFLILLPSCQPFVIPLFHFSSRLPSVYPKRIIIVSVFQLFGTEQSTPTSSPAERHVPSNRSMRALPSDSEWEPRLQNLRVAFFLQFFR